MWVDGPLRRKFGETVGWRGKEEREGSKSYTFMPRCLVLASFFFFFSLAFSLHVCLRESVRSWIYGCWESHSGLWKSSQWPRCLVAAERTPVCLFNVTTEFIGLDTEVQEVWLLHEAI